MVLGFAVKAQQTQEPVPGNLTFGFKVGYSDFTLKGKDVPAFSSGPVNSIKGFYAGIALDTRLSAHFSLRHEAGYAQKGAIVQLGGDSTPVFRSKFRTAYVDIAPISPVYHIAGVEIFAGPYVGFMLNAAIQSMDESGHLYWDKRIYGDAVQPGNYTHKMDAGVIGGFGYALKNGLNIGARYVYGMTPIREDTSNENYRNRIFNRGFTITLGYTIWGRK